MFHIHCFLPKNRAEQGWLHLAGPDGALRLYNIPARGKADNGQAAKHGNESRDTTQPYGDTPSGTFVPAKIARLDPPDEGLGTYFLPMEGVSGDGLRAKQNGRTGIGIHAGRGDANLMATYGCIRVHDKDMADIVKTVGDDPVKVTVEDI